MLQFILTIYFLLILSLNSVHGLLGNQCNLNDLRNNQCDLYEICDGNTKTCQCLQGYIEIDTKCVKDDEKPNINDDIVKPNSSSLINEKKTGTSLLTDFLLPFFILLSLAGGVYLSTKYDLLNWIRNKVYSFRRTHYDEFMIGQDIDDDPPLR